MSLTSTLPEPIDAAVPAPVAMASAVGATIEWYDFFLYGTAAGLVFEKLFFNGLSGPAAQFAAFGTFAVGFLARPVGGFIFGHFGDRVGRKKMLLLTLVIMGVGTAAIGLLPSYDAIGWWAPVLLVTLRVLQGIGVGGEYGGAVLLAVEYAPAERRGFFGSFAHIGVPGGLLLASGAFSLASLLPDEAFLGWGWRACFLASVVLLGDRRLHPAVGDGDPGVRARPGAQGGLAPPAARPARGPAEAAAARHGHALHRGLHVQLLLRLPAGLRRHQPRPAALAGARRGHGRRGRSASCSCRSPVRSPTGSAASRCSGSGAWLALVVAFPVAALVQSANGVAVFLVFVIGLGLLYGTVYGPLAAFWSELFDTRYRYTALSTLYQMSGIVASGFTPLDRGLAGQQGRREPVVGGGLQRRRRGDQPDVRAVPAGDPGSRPRRPDRGGAGASGPRAGLSALTRAAPGSPRRATRGCRPRTGRTRRRARSRGPAARPDGSCR